MFKTQITSILFIATFLLTHCTTSTHVRLLPAKETAEIETLWKNKTVGKGSEFNMELSDSIFEERDIIFLQNGKPIGTEKLEVNVSVPVLFLGWLAFGIPYIWMTPVRENQTFDLSSRIEVIKN